MGSSPSALVFFYAKKKGSHRWSKIIHRYNFGNGTHETCRKPKEKWHLKVLLLVWSTLVKDEAVVQLSEPLPPEPEVVVRFSLLLLSFYFTHAHRGYRACAPAFFDVIILTHMDFDIQIDNLGGDSRLSNSFSHGPDSPLEGPSLGQLEPHGSRGFLLTGETACTLRGNWWMSSRKKGKRTARTPDGTCGQPDRGITRLTLGGFLARRPGEDRFSSGKSPGGLALPRTGDSSTGGVPDVSLVRPTVEEPPFPGKVTWTSSRETRPWKERKYKKRKNQNPK